MGIQQDRSRALALEGGATVGALLDLLGEKKLLTTREVRAVLRKAAVGPCAQTPAGHEASGMIAAMLLDRFAPGRG